MTTVAAFENRKEELREQLKNAKPEEAASRLQTCLEMVAADLAREDQVDVIRQRRQAVLALAKEAPALLEAGDAGAELVVVEPKEVPAARIQKTAFVIGIAILIAVAVFEVMNNRITLALLQTLGAVLLITGVKSMIPAPNEVKARGIAQIDVDRLILQTEQLMQTVDMCVEDLGMADRENTARLNGTADDAMLDMLSILMEARASGEATMAVRSLDQAEHYLRMLGIDMIFYDGENSRMFDLLPSLTDARTIRPALLQDGKILRRGVATRKIGGYAS